jgi:predicted nucleotidyltransferase
VVLDSILLARLRSAAETLFRGGPVQVAYAYGSRVSGAPRFDSDLDVGYYLEGDRRANVLSIRDEMRLAGKLSEAVGLTVDLRNLGGAPLELRGRVLEEGVRIYSGDPAARVALERELLARYHDYKDTFRQMHELRLRAVHDRGI